MIRAYRIAAAGVIQAELAGTVAKFPDLAKLVTIGESLRGVPIQAVKVTKDARDTPDGERSAVMAAR